MQTWTSNRKPDGKALVTWLLDVRGSQEIPRILDLNVSHVCHSPSNQILVKSVVYMKYVNICVFHSAKPDRSHRVKTYMLVTAYQGFRVRTCNCATIYLFIYHGQKSWDTFAFRGRFSIHTGPTPPLTPQRCCTRLSRIFSEFQLCIGWGEGELQENLEKDALF